MNPLGKGQDTVFETLEKSNFIAPPGGDERDQEDISKLCRAMELLTPGIVLAALLPQVAGDWTLVAFLGALLTVFGCVRLWEENGWFKLAMWCAVAQGLLLCFRLVGQTMLPMLLESALYPIAGYGADVAGAAVPAALAVGLWLYDRKAAPFMTAATAAAIALPLLGGLMLAVRAVAAAVGAGSLIWLLVRTKREE